MKDLRNTKVGLASMTIIFLLLYGYFSTLGNPLNVYYDSARQGFTDDEVRLGNLGGFHLLKNISYSDEEQFHRLMIETKLNRSTATPEAITIPYLIVEEIINDQPTKPDSPYLIEVSLSDTKVEGIPKDRPLAIFQDIDDQSGKAGLFKEAWVSETADETTKITIYLTRKVLFRVAADNSGAIIVDVLK